MNTKKYTDEEVKKRQILKIKEVQRKRWEEMQKLRAENEKRGKRRHRTMMNREGL